MKTKAKFKQTEIGMIPEEGENKITLNKSLNLDYFKQVILKTLSKLYHCDDKLFLKNEGRGVSERCFGFRFAHYLQENIPDYFVDCDYNSSFDEEGREVNGKLISEANSDEEKCRFIDIIVHLRENGFKTDLIAFEIKKWNSRRELFDKDINNLKELTSTYGYVYGFHLVLGKTLNQTRINIYKREGELLEEWSLNNETTKKIQTN